MKKKHNEQHNTNTIQIPPFIAPGSLEPITQEELEKRKRRIARAEAIGLSIMRVTSEKIYDDEYENPYHVEALRYILDDMDVPKEVLQKIKEFEKIHSVKENT